MQHVDSSRSIARAAIITAASELLVEGGARALTTRAVADRAGVQAPTLYRLVGDKDDLIDAVAERLMATYVASKQTAQGAESTDPIEALHEAWRRHIDFGLANPELYRLMTGRAPTAPSSATVSGIDALRRYVHSMAVAGLLGVSERRAVEMIHAAGNGAVLALLEQQPADRDLGMTEAMFNAVLGGITSTTVEVDHSIRHVLPAVVRFGAVISDLHALSDAEQSLLREWISRSIAHEEDASEPGVQTDGPVSSDTPDRA